MIVGITGVLADGSEPVSSIAPAAPTIHDIAWPRAESGILRITVLKADRTVADLTGGAISFVVRRRYHNDPSVDLAATLTAPGDGLAEIAIAEGDTEDLVVDTYRYDIQFTDAGGGRWQIVPASNFDIAEIIG